MLETSIHPHDVTLYRTKRGSERDDTIIKHIQDRYCRVHTTTTTPYEALSNPSSGVQRS